MRNVIRVQHEYSLESFTDPVDFTGHTRFPITVPFCERFVEENGKRVFQRFEHIQLLNLKSGVVVDPNIPLDYDQLNCDDYLDIPSEFIGWNQVSGEPIPIGTTIQVIGYGHDVIYEELVCSESCWKGLSFGMAEKVGSGIQYEINRFWSTIVSMDVPYFDHRCTINEYYSLLIDMDQRGEPVLSKKVVFDVSGMPVVLELQGGQSSHSYFRYQTDNSVKPSQINPNTPLICASIFILGDSMVYLTTYGVGEFESTSQQIISSMMEKYLCFPS